MIDRRRFIAALAAVGGGLAAPRALAITPMPYRAPAMAQAFAALDRHSARIAFRDLIGVVDFARPSRDRRLEIVDVASRRVIAAYLVSHGKGSDPGNTGWLQRFSNQPGSNASCSGSFVSGEAYVGKHGPSRRLHGLDESNSNAFARAIVMHGADYVSPRMVDDLGRIGRSLGCFAVEQHVRDEVLDLLGPGRLLFAAG